MLATVAKLMSNRYLLDRQNCRPIQLLIKNVAKILFIHDSSSDATKGKIRRNNGVTAELPKFPIHGLAIVLTG